DATALEGLAAGRERPRVPLRPGRRVREAGAARGRWVLLPVDRDRAARREEAPDNPVPEQRRGREVVDLAGQGSANQQRVDEVVRVVDAEEYRTPLGHAFRMADIDGLEEEPEPKARDGADGPVEPVRAVPRGGGVERDAHGVSCRACSRRCRPW